MDSDPQYVHLLPGAFPSQMECRPTRALLVLDCLVDPDCQNLVSRWLLDLGCLYMLAWGAGCSSWDDSVDFANLEAFDYGDIPDGSFVMTTWHEGDSLGEFLEFAKHSAAHPVVPLERTLILHIGSAACESQLVAAYAEA